MVIVDNDRPGDAQSWASAALATGVADGLPSDPAARVEALEMVVERQAALLEREDEVHRVLVRVVLAGGAKLVANSCRAAILPDYRPMKGFSCRPIPQDRGFPLIGDANRGRS